MTCRPCAAQELNTILTAHESSVASLQYLRCNFTNTSSSTFFTRPRVLTGTIIRGPSLLVVTAKATDFESLLYARPGRVECLRAEVLERGGKRERHSLSLVSATLSTALDVDPFRDMLMTFLGGPLPTEKNGLRQIVKKTESRKVVGDELHLRTADGSATTRLSVRNNYLVAGFENHLSHESVANNQKASVLEFFRSSDGVIVPASMSYFVTCTTGDKTTTLFDHTTRLTEIDTKSFDENAVRPRYPRDTKVTNSIDGTNYTIGESGNVVGEVRPSRQSTIPATTGDQKALPTAVEPARTGWWVLPVAGSVLAAAAAAWLLARRRR